MYQAFVPMFRFDAKSRVQKSRNRWTNTHTHTYMSHPLAEEVPPSTRCLPSPGGWSSTTNTHMMRHTFVVGICNPRTEEADGGGFAACGSVSLAELGSSGSLRDPVSKIEGEGKEDTQHWSLAFTCTKAHMCIHPTHRAQGVGVWTYKKEKENANLCCYLLFIRSVTSTLLS